MVEKMKLIHVQGTLPHLDEFLGRCCLDGRVNLEPASQYMSASLGYGPLNEEDPYTPLVARIETLAQQLEAQLAAFWAQAACHPTGSHKEEQIQAALDYINQHYADESLSMGAVAEHLRMSPSHFSRLFKEIMEESFPSYVNRLRLSSAYQRLLDERDSTIEKIAQESGFYSSSYFTTLFRKQYGLSPSQARRRPPEKGE